MRRGSYFQLVGIGLVAGAIATAVAILVPWLPHSASKQADRIYFTFWFTNVICLALFSVVAAILVYAIINFRAEPGDWSDGPPVHGNTTIEIVWTVIPAVLVTTIAIASGIVLTQNGNAGSNPLVVRVFAQQFAWKFQYPNGTMTPTLNLPISRTVKLEITASDVIHSFWVPEFAQKQDAVPGQVNDLVITPTREGTYPVICTELCGLGHALMRSSTTVMSQADFDKWYAGTGTAPAPGGGGGTAGAVIFTKNGCGACHTLKAVPDANGKVGPDLDSLSKSAKAAGEALVPFIKESIVDPNKYIAARLPAGRDAAVVRHDDPGDAAEHPGRLHRRQHHVS